MKILVAEDSRYYRKILESILTAYGYQAVFAGDGEEAWGILQGENSPQLVILDWIMPKMTGVEVCKAVRNREKNCYTYIILLTSMDGKENIITGFEAGADDYIIKPFDEQELLYRLKIGERIIRLENKILKLAMLDCLTGILNRRAFMERLESELERSRRFDLPLSLIMIDIDDFKKVNDNYGHQVGDHVLSVFAQELSKHIRKYDLLGRYGGEEFIICLSGTGYPKAKLVAERLRQEVDKLSFKIKGIPFSLHLTASFGIACLYTSPDENIDSLIKRADDALYKAKLEGKNRVCSNI